MNKFQNSVLMDDEPGVAGGDGPVVEPVVEPEAPPALTMDQVNEVINRALANQKREFMKLVKPDPPPVIEKPAAKLTDGSGGETLADKALLRKLEETHRQMEEMQHKMEEAQAVAARKELDSLLRQEVSKYDFSDQIAREDLFTVLRSKVSRSDDGGIFSEDGASLEEYVKKNYEARNYAKPAKPVGASGAQTTSYRSKGVDIEAIKPGMSDATRQAVIADLQRALGK